MNRIPARGRLLERIAAATAVVFGAALIAYPGAAGAQDAPTGTDCAALGADPIADGLEAALETAVACGVEVRIASRATPFATVYATPAGQLHYVGTADPVQGNGSHGPADATLTASSGTLVPVGTEWPIALSGTDTAAPLLRTEAAFIDWVGVQPVPAHSGSVAEYGELAPGLVLTAESTATAVELTFAIADATAWDALDTGLTVTRRGAEAPRIGQNTILAYETDDAGRTTGYDLSSPFTVRDADGTAYRAGLALGDGGALTVTLPDSALGDAAYPLTLTTAFTDLGPGATSWGSATSAHPDLSVYRGEAGLDQPYFTAAGQSATAVAGAYCDALADPSCTGTAEAASYWAFWSPLLSRLAPADANWLAFTAKSATFRVDAADGAACVAPDLYRASSIYTPGRSWNYRVPLSTDLIAGTCQDGTAVYDVSGVAASTWSQFLTLAMPGGAETARFDGGSARLDAYFSVDYFRAPSPVCSTSADAPGFTRSSGLSYGGFTAKVWRPELFGHSFTWAAEVVNRGTGKTVASSGPTELTGTAVPTVSVPGLPDGHYETRYEFVSTEPGLNSTKTCHTVIDTVTPDLLDVSTVSGTGYIGGSATVEVAVSDAGFPDGVNALTVVVDSWNGTPDLSKTINEGSVVTFAIPLQDLETRIDVRVQDKAGNITSREAYYIEATHSRNDYNGDGHQDLMAVRKSDGYLMFYAGKGDGTFKTAVSLGYGWGKMDIVMSGDLTGDGKADLLARNAKTGVLYTYPGNGTGGLGSRITVGPGWNSMVSFASAGDYNEDGKTDLMALRHSDRRILFYPGRGDGTFGSRTAPAFSWMQMWDTHDSITTFGDLNRDGHDDLLAHSPGDSAYVVYLGDGKGGFDVDDYDHLGWNLSDSDLGLRFDQVAGTGDYDGDGYWDLLAVNGKTRSLEIRSFNPTNGDLYARTVVGGGWNKMRLPAVVDDWTYDHQGDGSSEVVVRDPGTNTIYTYFIGDTGKLDSAWMNPMSGSGWSLLETAGDLTGDGYSDLLARKGSTGVLYVYPGNGGFGDEPRITVGSGWNSMSAIASGHDYNGDGEIDLFAREKSTGYLWFYPGRGDGTFGARTKIGSGWNGMRDITAPGDLDHDGHADLLAIRAADNCLYFYGGNGNGTLKSRVKMSCGWASYDSLAAVGDYDHDGHEDWIARRKSDGALFLYRGNGAGGYSSRPQISTSSWTGKYIA
ncbi:FG-GAP repeat domain-containing protein [Glycomyces sp. NPDC048151]|uniref:FG-GAP repeat domain-containing protein n=1 Tax=Glycomyces sp. NPDC048151 TaxID=3364002 RepID=UPI00371FF6F9